MSGRRARIGIIGTGWWATYAHLPSLTTYPAAEVVAIADPSAERLAQAAEVFGVRAQFADYRSMLEQQELDGVVVATPHATHYAIARDVLTRGLPLMLEKPMVLHAREAHELVALAAQHEVPLIVGYPWHFVEQHRELRARIARGALGQLQLAECLFASMVLEYYRANPQAYADVFRWRVTGPQPTTYSDPAIAGGGQGHLQVTHSAALLLWLTDLRPRQVSAFMEQFDLKVDLVDAINVRFEGGALGSLTSTGGISASQSSNNPHEYRIFGTEGYALLDPVAGTCSIYSNDGSTEQLEVVPSDDRYPMSATSRHLVDLVLGTSNVTNQSSGEFGARVVELLDAAYRSAAEGRVVNISEL